mmetsp:Transcript_30340/g.69809  ORF Transcript_30340/g.69809 Transcript_30340/m.69809 type:complete len:212 (+) Transcript_30340:364-999(+)
MGLPSSSSSFAAKSSNSSRHFGTSVHMGLPSTAKESSRGIVLSAGATDSTVRQKFLVASSRSSVRNPAKGARLSSWLRPTSKTCKLFATVEIVAGSNFNARLLFCCPLTKSSRKCLEVRRPSTNESLLSLMSSTCNFGSSIDQEPISVNWFPGTCSTSKLGGNGPMARSLLSAKYRTRKRVHSLPNTSPRPSRPFLSMWRCVNLAMNSSFV